MKDSSLQKLHDVELEILDEIVRICSKHDLRYYLVGGTLLGAVRHKGFIPWDDDLDIGMPREDYKIFCQICETELNDSYYLHSSAIDPEYWLPFVKVRKKNTVFDEGRLKNVTNKYNGIWVDIFPLDYAEKAISNSKRLRTFIYKQLTYLISYRSQKRLPNKKTSLLLYYITRCFKISTFRRIQDKLIQWENHKKNVEYYVNYASQYNTMKQTMHRTVYEPACELQFRDRKYLAPANYHSFLLQLYGENYMLYPPYEKRRTHDPLRLSFNVNGADEDLEHAKHYKVGYTTGVFDLFHIGHLNILKLAKEQCDYLIVGVSTDENVQTYKHKKPFIPFEQRVKIVEAIRYVDQVVPQVNMDKLEAWHKYHFEVIFHGSDWKGSSMYDDITRRLKEVGCDMVFLPHTSGVSSSMLCEKLGENNK